MIYYEAELVVDSCCILGEGPVWDDRSGRIYWVDVDGKTLHRYDTLRGNHSSVETAYKIASFALRVQEGAIAAGESGLYWMDLDTGELERFADPEAALPYTMFNDGKCDELGRFYAGTASSRHAMEGALYRIEPRDLSVTKCLEGIGCSNGIAWSLDRQTMFYIDSLCYSVDALDYDLPSGGVSRRRTVIPYESRKVLPDGMTWDEEGMIWVAEWGGWSVTRWNPLTGEKLAVVRVPTQFVTSCVFGGENEDELFITTASRGMSDAGRALQPAAGGLFRAKTNVRGAPCYRFHA